MEAVRLHEGPEVRVEDVPEPALGAGQIRVAVRVAGICGTDLHAAHGRIPVPVSPVVMGHEGAQVVDLVATGALDLSGSITARYPLARMEASYAAP